MDTGYYLDGKDHGLHWTLRWSHVYRDDEPWYTVKVTTFERVEDSPIEKPTETILYSGAAWTDAHAAFIAEQRTHRTK